MSNQISNQISNQKVKRQNPMKPRVSAILLTDQQPHQNQPTR
ncbi:hypothetical protein [Pseudomonas sp. I2]